MGQISNQVDELALWIHIKHILDAYADVLLRQIDSWLDGEDHALIQWLRIVPRIMYVDAHKMPQAMHHVLAQRLSMQVFAMRVDIVKCYLVQRIGLLMQRIVYL